jgi:hypothetical protein
MYTRKGPSHVAGILRHSPGITEYSVGTYRVFHIHCVACAAIGTGCCRNNYTIYIFKKEHCKQNEKLHTYIESRYKGKHYVIWSLFEIVLLRWAPPDSRQNSTRRLTLIITFRNVSCGICVITARMLSLKSWILLGLFTCTFASNNPTGRSGTLISPVIAEAAVYVSEMRPIIWRACNFLLPTYTEKFLFYCKAVSQYSVFFILHRLKFTIFPYHTYELKDRLQNAIMTAEKTGRNCPQARRVCCYKSSSHWASLAKKFGQCKVVFCYRDFRVYKCSSYPHATDGNIMKNDWTERQCVVVTIFRYAFVTNQTVTGHHHPPPPPRKIIR